MTRTTSTMFQVAGSSCLGLALLALGGGIALAAPPDPVSNPHKLEYRDATARRPDFQPPFLRDGVVVQPQRFKDVRSGLAAPQLQALLGQPVQRGSGLRGSEWDYNFKFRLPQSQNYLVCQYKVVMDSQGQTVREAYWRRKQCLDLASAAG